MVPRGPGRARTAAIAGQELGLGPGLDGTCEGDGDGQGFLAIAIITLDPFGLGVPAAGDWALTSPSHSPSPW